MPLKKCTKDGKSGWKWGDSGKCFTGNDAKEKAKEQGRAIEANKSKGMLDKVVDNIKKLGEKNEY